MRKASSLSLTKNPGKPYTELKERVLRISLPLISVERYLVYMFKFVWVTILYVQIIRAAIFGVGAPEALLVGVVALVVFGPKGLAQVLNVNDYLQGAMNRENLLASHDNVASKVPPIEYCPL